MKHFKTFEAYKLGVNGVGSLKNSLASLKRQNINGRYVDPEILAQGIRNEYEAITGEKYEDEVQMSMDNTIADIIGHYKLDGPDFMAAWDKVVKESVNEAKGGQIMPGDYVKNQHGNIYQRVDGKVGKHDAYVRVTNGKPGKKKTGLHDSFKLTLVNKDELEEAAPGFKHDCAAKVVHETYGKGNCIPEKHTLVKEGKKYVVTHYDVLFENGKTVEDIPVSELDIKTTNEHWHKGYKKKKK